MTTILYPEAMYPDDVVERAIYPADARIVLLNTRSLAEVPDEICAATDGLLIFRHWATAADFARFPRLRAIVRMGVGYDRIDRKAAVTHGVTVCNVPDYGTMEVADHAIALTLALRRGLLIYHANQRAEPPAAWAQIDTPLVRRLDVQTFGVLGLGRIGTAAALRARALGFRVVFYDPYRPNGTELALGLHRARTFDELLRQSDVLSLHPPLTPETGGMIGARELALLPEAAIVVNTARGPILDVDAVLVALRSGRLAGAGLDVLPTEPPVAPIPALLAAYRARDPELEGRLIITPHSAFHSPQAWADIRRLSAETMAAALFTNRPQNVITPEMF